ATLLHYLKGEAEQRVPVWKMIAFTPDALARRARRWASRLHKAGIECKVEPGESAIGGGSLPGETLPTWLVSIRPKPEDGSDSLSAAGRLAALLRQAPVPVIARVERGAVLIDPRTVQDGEDAALLAEAIEAAGKLR